MNGGEAFLLLLGPALALAAGLAIYAIAARGNDRAAARRAGHRRSDVPTRVTASPRAPVDVPPRAPDRGA